MYASDNDGKFGTIALRSTRALVPNDFTVNDSCRFYEHSSWLPKFTILRADERRYNSNNLKAHDAGKLYSIIDEYEGPLTSAFTSDVTSAKFRVKSCQAANRSRRDCEMSHRE